MENNHDLIHKVEEEAEKEAAFDHLPESPVTVLKELSGKLQEDKDNLVLEEQKSDLEDFSDGDANTVRVALEMSEARKDALRKSIKEKEEKIKKIIQNN